jgi:hypothetical protein
MTTQHSKASEESQIRQLLEQCCWKKRCSPAFAEQADEEGKQLVSDALRIISRSRNSLKLCRRLTTMRRLRPDSTR